MKERVVVLGFDTAIEKIKDCDNVFYRSGVWNKYSSVPKDKAIQSIKASGYGADIYYDKDTNEYYVSVPCESDMW